LTVPDGLGSLGVVLERAGQPDPGRRYPDAGAMSAALGAAARELAVSEYGWPDLARRLERVYEDAAGVGRAAVAAA
jgi:hypothetical protein